MDKEFNPYRCQRFRLTGKTDLKMSNHSIKPPVLQTSGGDVKYRDDVEVSFELIVGPKRKGEKSTKPGRGPNGAPRLRSRSP